MPKDKKDDRKAKPEDLGTGQARRAAEAVQKRKRSNRSALAAAQAALGARRKAQTTDSNN